jgi:dGTPase
VRGLVDWLVSGLIQGTLDAAEVAGVTDADQVRSHARRLASFIPAAQATNRQLKQFLHHTVYFSEAMVEERRRSAARVAELFKFYTAHPEKLPKNYLEPLEHWPVHRVVCDYIAGMTDGFFLRTYQETLLA